ncbi:MAG: UTP--glucose-1-phosphate uridylyltransferase [Opitutales bacterium]
MKTSGSTESIIEAFKQAGQGHVFRFIDELEPAAKERLLTQAASVDLEELNALIAKHVKAKKAGDLNLEDLEPAPYVALPEHGGDAGQWETAREAGADALKAGRVGAFTVAGGQGTRLGFDGPKGTLPVTPVSKKTLFQVFAEKIARSGERFGVTIPWFILTSEVNHEATVAAFEQNGFFGLDREFVSFITQGVVPAVDFEGRILLAGKDRIAMSPDGHGGALRALVRSGATERMKELGVDVISYFQVDNPIVRCIDPAFIGFHVSEASELSSKMVPKAYPGEKVGHFCTEGGATRVIEYSDMPREMQEETLTDGSLRFKAGSVAIHVFDRNFVERVGGEGTAFELPFHRAEKKVPYVDHAGAYVEPEKPNGIKFEMFVFDALPLAKHPVIIEAARADDFSPVKNAEGADSPRTAKEDQLRLFARWLRAAGEEIETDETGLPHVSFEISPRFAVDQADFLDRWNRLARKPVIQEGTIVDGEG